MNPAWWWLRLAVSVVFVTAGVKMALCKIVHNEKTTEKPSPCLAAEEQKQQDTSAKGRKKPFRWKTCIQRRTRAIEKRTQTKPSTISCSYTIKKKGDFTSKFSSSSAAVRVKAVRVKAVRIKCPCSHLPHRTRSPGRIPDSTSLAPLKQAERECLSSR